MDIRTLMEGLAAGDALGVTSEFESLEKMRITYLYHKPSGWPFVPVGGGPFGFRAGHPSDDSEMALAIVHAWCQTAKESASSVAHFDGARIAANFVKWLDSKPRDIGHTTRLTLEAVLAGTPWHRGGYEFWRRNPKAWSNGSLMRNGVVAGMGASRNQLFRHTLLHGLITHWAPLPALCCAAQSWLIHHFDVWCVGEEGGEILLPEWKEEFRKQWDLWICTETDPLVIAWRDTTWEDHAEAWKIFMAADCDPDSFRPFAPIKHIGFCVTTLQIGIWAMHWAFRDCPYPTEYLPEKFPTEPFLRTGAEVLSWVAMIGRDADTYGATAGPMIAAVTELRRDLVERLSAVESLPAVIPDPVEHRSPYFYSQTGSSPMSGQWMELGMERFILSETQAEIDHYTALHKIAEPYRLSAAGFGSPLQAIAHVTADFVVVAEVAFNWQSAHVLQFNPIPYATRRLKDATQEWLLESLAAAEQRRKDSYLPCESCGRILPPENRDGPSCHRCMELSGVTF